MRSIFFVAGLIVLLLLVFANMANAGDMVLRLITEKDTTVYDCRIIPKTKPAELRCKDRPKARPLTAVDFINKIRKF